MEPSIIVNAWILQSIEDVDSLILMGGKILIISETIPDYLTSPQYGSSCIRANDLLPDYNSVGLYIDGDKQGFMSSYFAMLDSPYCSVYFATILSAIVNSIPLGIVFGPEQIEVDASAIILQYFATRFGIRFGHSLPYLNEPPVQIGSMDRNYVLSNFEYLYLHDLLTPSEIFVVWPNEILFSYHIVNKMIADLRPVVSNPSNFDSYVAYFEEMKKLYKGRGLNRQPMIDPLTRCD